MTFGTIKQGKMKVDQVFKRDLAAALVLTKTEPQNPTCPTTEGKSLAVNRKPMLGTQRNVIADTTSFDRNGVPVLVYNRTKTKSNNQVSKKKTLSAQHLCGPGGKSRATWT